MTPKHTHSRPPLPPLTRVLVPSHHQGCPVLPRARKLDMATLTGVLVVPDHRCVPLLHKGSRGALAEVLEHQQHALLPLPAAHIRGRHPVLEHVQVDETLRGLAEQEEARRAKGV